MNYQTYTDIINRNRSSFKKCGVTADILCDLENYDITVTIKKFHGRIVLSKETKKVDALFYANVCSWAIYDTRIKKSYCFAGYIPLYFSTHFPDNRSYRNTWEFTIAKKGA